MRFVVKMKNAVFTHVLATRTNESGSPRNRRR